MFPTLKCISTKGKPLRRAELARGEDPIYMGRRLGIVVEGSLRTAARRQRQMEISSRGPSREENLLQDLRMTKENNVTLESNLRLCGDGVSLLEGFEAGYKGIVNAAGD
jgi:hypothetical protein